MGERALVYSLDPMTTIIPFRGFFYNSHEIPALSDVVIPPYDNIAAEKEASYLKRSPYNFAHIILPNPNDPDYKLAKEALGKWSEHNILAHDTHPSYYIYQQTFHFDGNTFHRRTLMCCVLLHDFNDAIVRPHENTYGKFKADRLKILTTTQCNLSHVFAMVKDPEGVLAGLFEEWCYHSPLLSATTDDDVHHSVWRMDALKTTQLPKFFSERPIYIVDGHHRYESALMYAREQKVVGNTQHPAAYMLFAIANAHDPALVVLPTHRMVRDCAPQATETSRLQELFDLVPFSLEALREFCRKTTTQPQFGLYVKGQLFLASPKSSTDTWKKTLQAEGPTLTRNAIVWSDNKIVRELGEVADQDKASKIHYEKDLDAAWKARDQFRCVIFHAPLAIEGVTDVADEKRFLPQKSTFFYPKIAAGLVMRNLAEQ